ncbi:MAG: OmpA family protein [Flavobacteriales bacterium]|nr:OmpA family protein [Flavobacteriales bacterium]MCB9168091.1 OmpA family protein [Flavobacteriales bacterium]
MVTFQASAQDDAAPGPCDPPTDKKIVKLLADAEKQKDPAERHRKLKETQEIDPECAECLFRLGRSAYERAKSTGAGSDASIGYFDHLQRICPHYHSDVPYTLGAMYYGEGKYKEAAVAFQEFLHFPTDDPTRMSKDIDKKTADVEEILPELQFYVDFYKRAGPFDPVVLANVSTAADEYLPMLSPDNDLLFFTRKSKYQAKGDIVAKDVEELTESRREKAGDGYDGGTALPDPFNLGDNYGGVTISLNNKEMFVTVCKPVGGGYNNCDIYRSHFDNHMDFATGRQVWEWTGLEDLGPNINTPDGWESQPTLSADGRTLYFATVRRDSRGTDIYSSTRDDKGEWSPARPVPGPIDTDGDEKAPFLHSDSHTLYFAARPTQGADPKGHRSIGGYDIFYSRLQDDGTWGKPVNIGHPINTEQDDHGLIVSADGHTAMFASSRFRGKGGLDIYTFPLPKDARPEDILVVKGDVRDEKGDVVKDAQVEITYMDTRKTEVINVGADGRYATVVNLKPGNDVVMTVKAKDHVFDTKAFSVEDTARGGSVEADMLVQKIEVGRSYKVNDIKYATNSAEITEASELILDQLIGFLKENPTVRIRIEGHTDSVGKPEDNMALSNDRAFTVMQYLQEHGIAGGRLAFKGYGPTKPIASNDDEAGRAENRRTEFVITGR